MESAPAPTPPDPTVPEPTTDPVDTSASADTNHYAKANLYEVFRTASHLNHRYIYNSETMPSADEGDLASAPTKPPLECCVYTSKILILLVSM